MLIGLGDASLDTRITNFGINTAGSIGTAFAAGSGALAGTASALGISTGVLTAGIGAALAGVTLLVDHLIANSGCGQTCIVASDFANQAEVLLKQNLAAWNAEPHTVSNQQQALANYAALWNKLMQLCGDPALGNAGKRCISDRERAGKFPWPTWYYDPIANAADVVDDSAGAVVSDFVGSLGSSPLPLLIAAGLAAYFLL